ncbi:MAG TPA: AI-2E family transporter [Pyrinomonadaceae bacterium]|jgi:predicted PurR-regulated permease PerM|nr:AI-2E family transporter [Pyrinomonadaceae bacterium]
MTEPEPQENNKIERRVFFDPSTPAVRSVGRVVIVTLVILQIAVLLGYLFYWLQNLILLVILSIFFAYLMDPLVKLIRQPFKQRNLEKWMPRWLAIIISYLTVFVVLLLAISYLAPLITQQFNEFAKNFPGYSEAIRGRLFELNERYQNTSIPKEVREAISNNLQEFITLAGASVTAGVGVFLLKLVPFLPWILWIPVLAFFFLKDINTFKASALRMFPSGRWRYQAEVFFYDMNRTLAAYTRAQLISCLLIGTICTIAFYIFGVPYALLLGVLAGALEFIPLAGPLAIGVLTVALCAFYSPWQALYVGIFLLALRFIHDYITFPRIVREGIHLHPLAIILAILAGAQIGGIVGIFLSIPVVAILAVIYKHILWITGRTTLMANFLEGEPAVVPPESSE